MGSKYRFAFAHEIPIISFPEGYMTSDIQENKIRENLWEKTQSSMYGRLADTFSPLFLVAIGREKHLPTQAEHIEKRQKQEEKRKQKLYETIKKKEAQKDLK